MCIAAFVWQAHPLYPLILLQNRDEYHNRPTEPVTWWDGRDILGGRDVVARGTWLGCSRTGRVAFLTNVLESKKNPKEFAEELVKEAHLYNGFNLIMADVPSETMLYISNRPKGEPIVVQEVPPGIHVLSNAKLDSPRYKAQHLGLNLKTLLRESGEGEIAVSKMVEKLMKDATKADKSRLPGILPAEWESNLSSIYIEVNTPLGRYGTRSTIALTVKTSGDVSFYEKYLEDETWKERTVNFRIQKLKLKDDLEINY